MNGVGRVEIFWPNPGISREVCKPTSLTDELLVLLIDLSRTASVQAESLALPEECCRVSRHGGHVALEEIRVQSRD